MFRWLLQILLFCSLGLLAAASLGRMSPLLDLANLIVVPAAFASLVLTALLLLTSKNWRGRIVLAIAAILPCISLIPPADAPRVCGVNGAEFRVAWLNSQGINHPEPIMAWLEREQPDMVAFAELSPGSPKVREAVAAQYPFFQSCLENQRCSTIAYSREEPAAMEGLSRGDVANRKALTLARLDYEVGGTSGGKSAPLNLYVTHLSRPLPLGRQREELAKLETLLTKPADAVIVGDFNANRRMNTLADFAARNRLGMTEAPSPTWPTNWGGQEISPVLQIDHILVGRNWAVKELRVSENLGSDHLGLVADLCRAP